jgi:two-component system cell cycle response regulator
MPFHLPAGAAVRSTILIVDDVPSDLLQLETLVKAVGNADPVSFVEADAALAWCQDKTPDLLLLSARAAGALAQLRALSHIAAVPLVVTAGPDDVAQRDRALVAGADDFIAKPVDALELGVRMRTMLKLGANARDLYRLATTDALTGLVNRGHFLAGLDEEVQRALRYQSQPVCLAILDVDHLRRVNDCYGHAAGDAVLREVAVICRTLFRKVDTVGRTGGEELAILLPTTSLAGAALVCDRLRRQVEETPIAVSGTTITVTISIGLGEFVPGEDVAQFLARTGRALAAAKAGGRNRITLAEAGSNLLALS